MIPAGSDLLTVGLLVALEAMLSADNALVMAVIVLGLPRNVQKKALRQGLVGAFTFRIAATLLAVNLIRLVWVKLVGGLYLLYLAYSHFSGTPESGKGREPHKAKPMFGLSAYWATVVRLELVNLMFSIDSILVAVAVSRVTWVVVTGGILGIVAMRLIAAQLLKLVERYPPLVDGAFIIIAWVGIELCARVLPRDRLRGVRGAEGRVTWPDRRDLRGGVFLRAGRRAPSSDRSTRSRSRRTSCSRLSSRNAYQERKSQPRFGILGFTAARRASAGPRVALAVPRMKTTFTGTSAFSNSSANV